MFQESIKASGSLSITVTNSQNVVTNHVRVSNLVVSTGKDWIASRLKTSGISPEMSFMAIGHDPRINTESIIPPTDGDLVLQGEKSRVSLLILGGVVSYNKVKYTGVFGPNFGTGEISEAGIFNDEKSGTMLCRTTFYPLIKNESDTFTIEWEVTIT